MAANMTFSVEEVISEVVQGNDSGNGDNSTSAGAKDIIASAVRELRSLRREVSNFVAFEDEVSQMLTSLFEKWHKNTPIAKRILKSTIEMGSLISDEVLQWMKIIHRRLSPRMNARNPWNILFTRPMGSDVFRALKDASVKSRSAYGLAVEQNDKEEILTFTNMRRTLRDLEKLSGIPRSDIIKYFAKECQGNRKGKMSVLVTEEKPFKLKYRKRQRDYSVECHYSFENEFGYVFS